MRSKTSLSHYNATNPLIPITYCSLCYFISGELRLVVNEAEDLGNSLCLRSLLQPLVTEQSLEVPSWMQNQITKNIMLKNITINYCT